MIIRNYFKN